MCPPSIRRALVGACAPFTRLPPGTRLALAALAACCTFHGGGKGAGARAPRADAVSCVPPVCVDVDAAVGGPRSRAAAAVAEADVARGWRVVSEAPSGPLDEPPGAVTNRPLRLRGGSAWAFRVAPPGWRFPWAGGTLTGVTVLARGEVRPGARTRFFPVPLPEGVSLLPEARWGLLPDGGAVAFRADANARAYYFVDVVAAAGPAPVSFSADRDSRLGSPVLVVRAGGTNRVPLLVGVAYAVTSTVPVAVSAAAPGGFAEIADAMNCVPPPGGPQPAAAGMHAYTVRWPLGFEAAREGRATTFRAVPYDPGGTFEWADGGPDGGTFTLTPRNLGKLAPEGGTGPLSLPSGGSLAPGETYSATFECSGLEASGAEGDVRGSASFIGAGTGGTRGDEAKLTIVQLEFEPVTTLGSVNRHFVGIRGESIIRWTPGTMKMSFTPPDDGYLSTHSGYALYQAPLERSESGISIRCNDTSFILDVSVVEPAEVIE